MRDTGLSASDVIDLIPVKPIGEHEQQISEIYKTKLIGLFEKIKPQTFSLELRKTMSDKKESE